MPGLSGNTPIPPRHTPSHPDLRVLVMSGRILTMARAISVLFLLILPLFFLTRVSTPAYAATNDTLNFQARLKREQVRLLQTELQRRFKLYEASTGGTLLWTETRDSNGGSPQRSPSSQRLPQRKPRCHHQLPIYHPVGPRALPDHGHRWYWHLPAWDGEMSPRLSLTAVPYAFKAQTARNNSPPPVLPRLTLNIEPLTVGDQRSFCLTKALRYQRALNRSGPQWRLHPAPSHHTGYRPDGQLQYFRYWHTRLRDWRWARRAQPREQ